MEGVEEKRLQRASEGGEGTEREVGERGAGRLAETDRRGEETQRSVAERSVKQGGELLQTAGEGTRGDNDHVSRLERRREERRTGMEGEEA